MFSGNYLLCARRGYAITTTENMPIGVDELIARVRGLDGVIRFDALAG